MTTNDRRLLRGLRVARRRHGRRATSRSRSTDGRIVRGPRRRRARGRRTCKGVTIPGLANAHSHAFQRALRGRTQRGGGSFWTWREDMYALAATLTPDRTYELAHGHLPRDAPGRDHDRRRVRLRPPQRGADRGRERDRHPAHAARRVLPRGWLRRRRPTPRNAASATATQPSGPSACRQIKGAKVGAAIHSVRAVPKDQMPTVVEFAHGTARCTSTSPSSAPRTRQCLAKHGMHARPTARRARRARPEQHRRPRDAPARPTTTSERPRSACARRPSATSRTASATPARSSRLGSDSHAIIDLFEEARAVELNLRLKTEKRGHFTAAAAARGRDQPRLPRLGRRRPDRARLPRRPRHARPHQPAPGDRRTRHHARIDRLRRDRRRRQMLITNIGTLVTNDPELGTLTNAVDRLRRRQGRLGRPRPPEAAGTHRFDAEGRAVIPGFVDSHGHLVFAGDRAEEFAARMEGRPYTAGGIKTTVAATRAASNDELRRTSTGSSRRRCAVGHHDRRDEVRLRAHRPRRAPQPRGRRTASSAPSSAPTSSRPRPTPTSTSSSSRARCSTPARRTRPGSTSSARTAPSTASRPGRSSRPASPKA